MSVGLVAEDSFERIAVGVALPTGDFWSANDAAATIQAANLASIAKGTRYLQYKRTTAGTGSITRTIPNTTALIRFRYYLTLITAVSANTPIQYYQNVSTNRCQILMATTRTLQLRNINVAVGSASSAMVLLKRYRFEYMFNAGASQQELNVYEPDESTVFYASGVQAASGSTANTLKVGNATSGTFEYHIDSIAQSDQVSEIGPVNPWDAGVPMMAA